MTNLRTNQVYDSIYQERFSLASWHIEEATRYIKGNLLQLHAAGLTQDIPLRILTAGTGREVKAWTGISQCQSISHLDISELACSTVRSISADSQIPIQTTNIDLCLESKSFSSGYSPQEKNYNLIFLSGVFHHLSNPLLALQNLTSVADDHSYFFLRIYRAGTARWTLVNELRSILAPTDPLDVIEASNILFPNISFGKILEDPAAYMVENYIDNMLVPFCHLFDCRVTSDFLTRMGYVIHQWSDNSESPPLGHMGEVQTSNGSSVVFSCPNPATSLSRLQSVINTDYRQQFLSSNNQYGLFRDPTIYNDFQGVLSRLIDLDPPLQHKLALIITTFIEAPYLKSRYIKPLEFTSNLHSKLYHKLAASRGPQFLSHFNDAARELLKNEI